MLFKTEEIATVLRKCDGNRVYLLNAGRPAIHCSAASVNVIHLFDGESHDGWEVDSARTPLWVVNVLPEGLLKTFNNRERIELFKFLMGQ